jgi:hypothetical protein
MTRPSCSLGEGWQFYELRPDEDVLLLGEPTVEGGVVAGRRSPPDVHLLRIDGTCAISALAWSPSVWGNHWRSGPLRER